jgi:hypothetical protein
MDSNRKRDYRQDPLAFAIANIDLLDGKQWEVGSRAWMIDIYKAISPAFLEGKDEDVGPRKLALLKPTQIGMTTMALAKTFHHAYYWPMRIIYTLPRQQDLFDLVSTRVDPMIANSPLLSKNIGKPDSTRAKRFAESYIFFMELTVEPRMMPADALFIDEVDLSDPAHMGTALNRLDASDWKLIHYFGTPTLPNYGVDGLYSQTDQRQWMVKCKHCGVYQVMDWDKNLRVVGSYAEPDDVFFGCVKCSKPLKLDQIQRGQWVAKKPALSDEFVGFHISQMLTHSPVELYKHFRDPLQTLLEFYRKRLGKPFETAGGSLERADIITNCFDLDYKPETVYDGSSTYFMGVDQGNELQVVVLKTTPDSDRLILVHVEIIDFETGFDRVKALMLLFNIRLAIIDADPNRHSAEDVRKAFPGRVYLADYTKSLSLYTLTSKGEENKKNKIQTNIGINRAMFFDDLLESVREGVWALPGRVDAIPHDIELLMDHLLSLKKDVQTTRTPSGEKTETIWRSLGPDHLAHSMAYGKLAAAIKKGRRYRAAAIGAKRAQEEKEEGQKDETPKTRKFIRIRGRK